MTHGRGDGFDADDATGDAPSVNVLGHRVDCLDLEATAMRCRDLVLGRQRSHHVSLNAGKVVLAQDDERLARILDAASLVNADGQSIVWASRLLGAPLPERVAGIDLMFRLLSIAEAEGFRVYFLGSRTDVLAAAIERLRKQYPSLRIAGSHHGYFGAAETASVCSGVNSSEADILFVAMSSPKKEYWVEEARPLLDVPLIVGVGGSLDVVAGKVARAPTWMQKAGLEWFFRFVQEPRRMWRRYLIANTRFVVLVARAVSLRVREEVRGHVRSPLGHNDAG
jgi:N-acetylglucosaminyldiphosphoundecaprenol N-acetyl-beta-D-mannosaminyltransferase